MLNKEERTKLLHDIKRMGKVISLIADEEKPERRKLLADLSRDEMDRLYADVEELAENGNDKKSQDNKG